VSVKVYVEGGGDQEGTITKCRQGFVDYCAKVSPKMRRPKIIPCGGRGQTFDKFKFAIQCGKADDLCVLLVDSEGSVGTKTPLDYLTFREKWGFPPLQNHRVFLMVQAMEAWFLADREALLEFYDGGFLADSLPGSSTSIEAVPKDDLEPKLKHASGSTKTKGEYHKVKHGFELLGKIDPAKVENASPHAASFHRFLRGL
jgi:hypothetical protein